MVEWEGWEAENNGKITKHISSFKTHTLLHTLSFVETQLHRHHIAPAGPLTQPAHPPHPTAHPTCRLMEPQAKRAKTHGAGEDGFPVIRRRRCSGSARRPRTRRGNAPEPKSVRPLHTSAVAWADLCCWQTLASCRGSSTARRTRIGWACWRRTRPRRSGQAVHGVRV